MLSGLFRTSAAFCLVAAAALLAAGCGQTADSPNDNDEPATPVAGEPVVDDHSGWWCAGHGVPEEECSMCSAKAAEQFKAKGDWCEEHNRAESQCFICGPDRKATFVALYEAKYGKAPPPLPE